jgi:anti-anti-sigma regulatory factor
MSHGDAINTISVARKEDTEYIRFKGVIRYSQCAGLEHHIEQIFMRKDFKQVIIDLEKAEMLDSTALGLLARVAIEARKFLSDKPIIFVKNGDILRILQRVCFDQVFNILADGKVLSSSQFFDISTLQMNENQTLETVIRAHQDLASLSASNKEMFKDITKLG